MLFWNNLLNSVFILPEYLHFNNFLITRAPWKISKSQAIAELSEKEKG